MNTRVYPTAKRSDPIKQATVAALNRILEPLIELMLDTGMTVHEFNKIIRERAVWVAMQRLSKEGSKESKSRVAIMTGLPRSEVAKILRSSELTLAARSDQLPAKRILSAWNDDPRFSAANGHPAILPIFGRSGSFEQLVERHGGGIPVRAMLDELTQMQALERLPDQKVRLRVPMPILTGLTPRSIAAVGERSHDLLQTLAHNRREQTHPLFEATAVSHVSDQEMISFVRREIKEQGINFISTASSLLNRIPIKKSVRNSAGLRGCRIGVTVFYFEDHVDADDKVAVGPRRSRRKNLRRRASTITSQKISAK